MPQKIGNSIVVLLLILEALTSRPCLGQTTSGSMQLSRVASGTLVENPEAVRWNSIVLLARPRIASGNVELLSSSIRSTVSSFVLTILATVEAYSNEQGDSRFRLNELGVGYSTDIGGKLTVVSLEDATDLGVRLSFFQRQMLSQNEKQLETVRVIASTTTLTLFDTPALVFRDAKHQDMTMRHFVWIDSRTGRLATLVWLVRESDGSSACVDEALRLLPQGMQEDRAIHVDGDEFILGSIPRQRAFALEGLPAGKAVPWTSQAKALAARASYDGEGLRDLTIALNATLQFLKQPDPTQSPR